MSPSRMQIVAMVPGIELDELVCRLLGAERRIVFPALASAALDETAATADLLAAGCDVGYRMPRGGDDVRFIHEAPSVDPALLFMPSRRDQDALALVGMLAQAGIAVTIAKGGVSVGDEGEPLGRRPMAHALAMLGALAMMKRHRFTLGGRQGRRIDERAEGEWTRALESVGPAAHWARRAEMAAASPGADVAAKPVLSLGGFGVCAEQCIVPGDATGRLGIVIHAPDRYDNSPAMWTALERATAKAFAGHSIASRTREPEFLRLVFDVPVRGHGNPLLRAA